NGDLKKVPVNAPTGLETEHGAVGTAQAQLVADPKTLEEYATAGTRLAELADKVKAYLEAEAQALAGAEGRYLTALNGLTDLDKADALKADNPPDLQALIKTYQDEWNDMENAENAGDLKTALAQVAKVQTAVNQLVTTAEENKQK